MTQDDQTGDQDGDTTTTDTGATTDDSSSASSQDAFSDGGSGSGASGDGGSSDAGSGSSDGGSSDSGSSDGGSGSSSSGDSGSGSGSGSGSDSSSNSDQTPAAELTVAAIQPASTSADSSIAASSGASTIASTDVGSSNAVAADAESGDSGGGGGGSVVGDLVTVGKAVASIMTASSPDYGMKSNPVSVLPQGADPASIVGISADPQELRVVISADNRMSMEMCNLPIVVQWRYGGNIGGKGHYIANASAFLDSGADIGAFYKGEVTAALQNPFNAGSDPKDMLASIDVHIEIKVTDKISPNSLFIVLEGNIRGDGAGKLAQRP